MRRRALAFCVGGLLAGSGCLPVRGSGSNPATPTAASEWTSAHAQAMGVARDSSPASAERILADFAQRFPGSPEAAEVPYWRAVLRLNPDNPTALREGLSMLETYLANTPAGTHRTEAAALRRLGLVLEQRNAALAAVPSAVVARPEDKAREEEMQKLRDELSAANAELDRIRRRVTRPRPRQ